MTLDEFLEMQELLQPHAYYQQFGNIRVASKNSTNKYRLDAADIVLLSQLIYWTPKAKKNQYWIYKTREEFSNETLLSVKQIDRARADLEAVGLIYYKVEGFPPKSYYKINFTRFIEYAKKLAEASESENPVVYVSLEELEQIASVRENGDILVDEVKVKIPDDWFPVFAQIRECGFYKDKADRDTKGEVFGYNQKLYTYIIEILDGTFYDNSGKNITNRHNLEGLTKGQILDWITKENRIPAGGTDYAYRTIVYTTSKATYSPMLNALCGKATSAKPKKLPEADKPSNAPDWIWEAPQLPSLYPEIQQDDRKFWGFYVNAIEYINDCQKKEGMDRDNWGMWTKLNNGLTNPPNNLFMDIFRAAKKADIGLDEIYSLKFGDVNNFLWILTAREMKQNHSIKILPDGKDYSYVYGDGPLNKAKYERRN